MNLNEWIRLIYGLTLGTSTPLIDTDKRHLFPLKKISLNSNAEILIGGAGNSLAVKDGDKILLVNTNMGSAAEQLYSWFGGRVKTIVNQKAHLAYSGGNYLFPEVENIYVGRYPRTKLVNEFGERKFPNHLISEKTEIKWGSEALVVEPIRSGMFENNLVIFLPNSRTLMLGDLLYNKIFPVFKMHAKVNVDDWILQLEQLLSRYQPEQVVPGEGEIATAIEVGHFVEFLREVSGGHTKHVFLKEKYHWESIPGLSSLDDCIEFFKSPSV